MLDELRNLFLRALKCDDGITATVLVDEWNEAVKRVQKVFDNMTGKASMSQPERKTRKWIKYDDRFMCNWICSECDSCSDERTDYCPMCGAKMEVDEK